MLWLCIKRTTAALQSRRVSRQHEKARGKPRATRQCGALTMGSAVRPQELRFRKRRPCRPARSRGRGGGPGRAGAAVVVVAPLKESPRYRLPSTSRVVRDVSWPSTGGSDDSVQKSKLRTCRQAQVVDYRAHLTDNVMSMLLRHGIGLNPAAAKQSCSCIQVSSTQSQSELGFGACQQHSITSQTDCCCKPARR